MTLVSAEREDVVESIPTRSIADGRRSVSFTGAAAAGSPTEPVLPAVPCRPGISALADDRLGIVEERLGLRFMVASGACVGSKLEEGAVTKRKNRFALSLGFASFVIFNELRLTLVDAGECAVEFSPTQLVHTGCGRDLRARKDTKGTWGHLEESTKR